jgi:surfeit locus 1 family protein
VNAKIKFGLITFAACLGVLITAALGNWQLSRAAQKQALQSDIEAQSAKPPVTAKALRALPDVSEALHHRATIRGFWVKDATVYLENRPMDGRVGFVVVTPLVMEAGSEAILVQRGWVPRDFESRGRLPVLETPLGMVEIEGLITPPPSKLYEPGPSTPGPIRQNIDLAQFQMETGLPLLAVTLQQTGAAGDGLQRDWPAVSLGVEKNRGYAFQWFALSSLIAGLYIWFQVIRRFFYRPQDPSRNV